MTKKTFTQSEKLSADQRKVATAIESDPADRPHRGENVATSYAFPLMKKDWPAYEPGKHLEARIGIAR